MFAHDEAVIGLKLNLTTDGGARNGHFYSHSRHTAELHVGEPPSITKAPVASHSTGNQEHLLSLNKPGFIRYNKSYFLSPQKKQQSVLFHVSVMYQGFDFQSSMFLLSISKQVGFQV